MTKYVTNAEYAKGPLTDICKKFGCEDWATKRQASKYRNGKGRLFIKTKKKVRPITEIMEGN